MGTTTIILLLFLFPLLSHAAIFTILNRCLYTVWAAANPGGGQRLDRGESWVIFGGRGINKSRVWARTGCNFNAGGHGRCQTGDCGSVLQCTGSGTPPNTLAEYTLNQVNNLDSYDISLVDGFNVPMDFAPTSPGCRDIRCSADIAGQCPGELKTAGGCNNPCTVFKTDEYCCTGTTCGPTDYSRFFKNRCPDAYTYLYDYDKTSTFSCPTGTDYSITFCPSETEIEMKKINLTIRIKAPNHPTVTASSLF